MRLIELLLRINPLLSFYSTWRWKLENRWTIVLEEIGDIEVGWMNVLDLIMEYMTQNIGRKVWYELQLLMLDVCSEENI